MTSTERSATLCGTFAAVACLLSAVALIAGRPLPAVGAGGVAFAAFVTLVAVRSVD